MLGYQIYIGNNCHADVVVDDAERHPEILEQAKQEFREKGFGVSEEAVIGHFCVLGSRYYDGDQSHLTTVEMDCLASMGEMNPKV